MLREKIAANQDLVARLQDRLNELGVASPSPQSAKASSPQSSAAEERAPAVTRRKRRGSDSRQGRIHSSRLDVEVFDALARQVDDRSLSTYPEFSVRVAARLQLRELNLSRPDFSEVRKRGGLRRLLWTHVREGRAHGGPGLMRVFRHWHRAFTSAVIGGLRSKPPIPREFDEVTYLLVHPEVAESVAAGDFSSGYEHWTRYGKEEGRVARFHELPGARVEIALKVGQVTRKDIPADFDEDAYLFLNPDITLAIEKGLFPSGYSHLVAFGKKEGRGGGPWEKIPDRTQFVPLLESRPYGVNLYGFLDTVSGLGSVARSSVQALRAAGIPHHPISIPSWAERVPQRSLPKFSPYRANFLLQNADMLPRFFNAYGTDLLKGCYNIGFWFWELPSARGDWHHLYRYLDEVWVASEFCRQSFQSITPLPVTRIPVVVEGLERKAIYSREHFNLPNDVFIFGYIFDVSSYLERKNPLCLIEAFKREFGDSSDVLLVLKYFNSQHDFENVNVIEQAIAGSKNIRSFGELMDANEITSLQNVMDCLVSPHRSEGFGYNLAEAMYLGKPVIATRYSSNLDFMRDDNSYLIDCNLTPIPLSVGPYLRGHVWADPSTEHLSHLMRTVFEDTEERERMARRGAEEIRTNFSAAAVGQKIQARLEEIGLDKQPLSASIFKVHGATGQPRLFHPETPLALADEIRNWPSRPVISVVTPVYNIAGAYLKRCIESVREQYYPCWELCLSDDGSTRAETIEVLESYRGIDPRIKIVRQSRNEGIAAASNRAAEISIGDYLAMLDNDDELHPEALYEVARAIQENPDIDLLYTDEDKLDEHGTFVDHYCKPDWSPEHLLSVMYLLHLLVVRKELFYQVGAFRQAFSGAQDYDLALRVSACAKSIYHVPKILYHWRKIQGSAAEDVGAKPEALDAGMRALVDHIQQTGVDAVVEPGQVEGTFRVRRRVSGNPLASLCILASGRTATVESRGKINLVEHFVKSIAEKTDYPNYEIVVVDDGNLSAVTRKALEGIPYRLESYTLPNRPFNFSKKANFAFRQARGKHILLLNDDMEVLSEDWLTAMMELIQQRDIGVVGAKLLFPDQRIQHAGVALGIYGGAAHVYHGYPGCAIGYNAFTHLIRNYSAVTAACLATRMDVIEATGGFDERFAVDYNDIDFCLRTIEQGYRVAFTPYAQLYHFEGTSLKRQTPNRSDTELFEHRWSSWLEDDPYYNPNLSRADIDFSIDAWVSGWPGAKQAAAAAGKG